MIRKFKRKTVIILTIIFWTVLLGILLAINLTNYRSNQAETQKILSAQQKILELKKSGSDAPELGDEKNLSIIYSVILDENQDYTVVFSPEGSGYTDQELIRIAKDIIDTGKSGGTVKNFRYQVVKSEQGDIISFVDYSIWGRQQYQMLIFSIIIGAAGMFGLFFVAFFLTGWLIRPINTAFARQKQFISDAGHELKTPLTVMKASIEMLEKEYGENKYLGYLSDENSRMTALVHELLGLSNLEKENERLKFEKINLSRIVEGTCLPFECLAFEKNIQLELQIQDNFYISGNEKQIRQLTEVLLDNAIRHTTAEGCLRVRLEKEKNKYVLQVMNQGEAIAEEERQKIFDRFYRVDKSRNREEGRYGLGLAIAYTIVEEHKGKITVECAEKWTIFNVKFNPVGIII